MYEKTSGPTGQTARWLDWMQPYNLIVQHGQGRSHTNVGGSNNRTTSNQLFHVLVGTVGLFGSQKRTSPQANLPGQDWKKQATTSSARNKASRGVSAFAWALCYRISGHWEDQEYDTVHILLARPAENSEGHVQEVQQMCCQEAIIEEMQSTIKKSDHHSFICHILG